MTPAGSLDIVSLYRPGLWTTKKFVQSLHLKMTYVSCDFFLTTEFACAYVRRYSFGSFCGSSNLSPKLVIHGCDGLSSHHGPLAAARWYQRHGKVVPKPSAPT
jgi:hypothetical protein